jgi:phosphoribosylanthranilate isomerase
VFVKICGLTRPDDAELAAELGASAVGMIFWGGSPRAITPEVARRVAAAVPRRVLTVGVFVDASRDDIARVVESVRLDAVQLHGNEDAAFVGTLPWPVIKAVTLPDDGTLPDVGQWNPATRVLLDALDPVIRGGTGRTVDWRRAGMLAARRPIILAGGIRADNVRAAVSAVRPAGIDVSSGVERAPGVKDADRLRALFDALDDMEAR